MIDRKHQKLLFSFIMALMMSGIMSLVITIFNLGVVSDLFSIWLQGWGFAFCVAFPTILIVSPLVQKLVILLLKKD